MERSLNPPELIVNLNEQDPWLMWLDEALDILGRTEVLDQIPYMVEAGLQGRSQFR